MAVALALALSACAGSEPAPGEFAIVEGFAGAVVADEPNAAVVGRDILANNGTAVDAAVAMGLALSVTLPSRAGLGGGGACSVYQGLERDGGAVVFAPVAPGGRGVAPVTARGLAVLHARYGQLRWELLVAPAENMARFGHAVSRAFARDLAAHRDKVAGEAAMSELFFRDGRPLNEGERLVQPELAGMLGGLRQQGGGYFHTGELPRRLAAAYEELGMTLTAEQIRDALPQAGPAREVEVRNDVLYLPPGPSGERIEAALAGRDTPAGGSEADMGTGFAAIDRFGNAVACVLTVNAPFGSGRLVPTTGMIAAAEPPAGGAVMAAGVVGNRFINKAHLAAYGGAGGSAAPQLATLINSIVRNEQTPQQAMSSLAEIPTRGSYAGAVACPRGTTSDEARQNCSAAADPRGHGLARLAR